MMIMDIINPEIPPTISPSLVGSDQEVEFFSTPRYQYAGARRSQSLHKMKNIREASTSSLKLNVNNIEIVGTKATRANGIKEFCMLATFENSTSSQYSWSRI